MFKSGFEQSFQQKQSKFRGYVDVVSQNSEFDFYDRIGLADDMNEVTARYGDTPSNDVPHERRRIGLADYDWGKGVDDKDLIRVAQDPTNAYTQAAVYSANRRIDQTIINSVIADTYIGKSGGTTVSFVPALTDKINVGAISNENGNITTSGDFNVVSGNSEGINIHADFQPGGGGSNSNITLDKLMAVRETMLRLESIEEGETLHYFLAPNQQTALLNLTEVKDHDFNSVRTLVNGSVKSFLGFEFHYTNMLPVSGTVRDNYVLGSKAMKLAISKDIDVDIFRRPDKKMIPWILIKLGLGCTRMWGEQTARVEVDEA